VGREVLDHVTSRWAVLILCSLSQSDRRFYEIRQCVEKISEKMLSQTLHTLVRDGLVERTVIPATPPKVSYALTPLGGILARPLRDLLGEIRSQADDIVMAQKAYDLEVGDDRSRPGASRVKLS
jgi:DNA-binding HxlR family transcriptional regulator